MTSPTAIVGYLALFTAAGFSFLFINLLVGKFLRPKAPNAEKLEVYECGEPTIGSSFVQFDLRFYVVALLFIIFDVEVAFFFPWATVFGKATHLMEAADRVEASVPADQLSPVTIALYRELGVPNPTPPVIKPEPVVASQPAAEGATTAASTSATKKLTPSQAKAAEVKKTARTLAMLSLFDIGAFFAVLMVGFAYVWKRGDLDWVRAVSKERAATSDIASRPIEQQPALSA